MSDKPNIQHELARTLGSLLHVPPTPAASLLFIQSFFKTIIREWPAIDRFRYVLNCVIAYRNTRSLSAHPLTLLFALCSLDKYLWLLRFWMNDSLRFLKDQEFDDEVCDSFNAILLSTALNPDSSQSFQGLVDHLTDVFLPELTKVLGADWWTLDEGVLLTLFFPWLQLLSSSSEPGVVHHLVDEMFENVIVAYVDLREKANRAAEGKDEAEAKRVHAEKDRFHSFLELLDEAILELAKAPETVDRNRKAMYSLHTTMQLNMRENPNTASKKRERPQQLSNDDSPMGSGTKKSKHKEIDSESSSDSDKSPTKSAKSKSATAATSSKKTPVTADNTSKKTTESEKKKKNEKEARKKQDSDSSDEEILGGSLKDQVRKEASKKQKNGKKVVFDDEEDDEEMGMDDFEELDEDELMAKLAADSGSDEDMMDGSEEFSGSDMDSDMELGSDEDMLGMMDYDSGEDEDDVFDDESDEEEAMMRHKQHAKTQLNQKKSHLQHAPTNGKKSSHSQAPSKVSQLDKKYVRMIKPSKTNGNDLQKQKHKEMSPNRGKHASASSPSADSKSASSTSPKRVSFGANSVKDHSSALKHPERQTPTPTKSILKPTPPGPVHHNISNATEINSATDFPTQYNIPQQQRLLYKPRANFVSPQQRKQLIKQTMLQALSKKRK